MEALDLTLNVILLLCLAGAFAGFVDTLVGGGGLITIPALLMSGVPPIMALGTNKLQAVAGSGTAAFMVVKRKRVEFNDVKMLMVAAFIGSLLGSIVIQFVASESLNIIIPVVIVFIGVYFILAPKQRLTGTQTPKVSNKVYRNSVLPSIGFYDGMFGPATGSFLTLAGVALRGHEIIHATATAKTLNFATNLASILVFIAFGKVVWLIGGIMIIGQLVGANLGARYLLRINPDKLRYLLIIVCFTILIVWLNR